MQEAQGERDAARELAAQAREEKQEAEAHAAREERDRAARAWNDFLDATKPVANNQWFVNLWALENRYNKTVIYRVMGDHVRVEGRFEFMLVGGKKQEVFRTAVLPIYPGAGDVITSSVCGTLIRANDVEEHLTDLFGTDNPDLRGVGESIRGLALVMASKAVTADGLDLDNVKRLVRQRYKYYSGNACVAVDRLIHEVVESDWFCATVNQMFKDRERTRAQRLEVMLRSITQRTAVNIDIDAEVDRRVQWEWIKEKTSDYGSCLVAGGMLGAVLACAPVFVPVASLLTGLAVVRASVPRSGAIVVPPLAHVIGERIPEGVQQHLPDWVRQPVKVSLFAPRTDLRTKVLMSLVSSLKQVEKPLSIHLGNQVYARAIDSYKVPGPLREYVGMLPDTTPDDTGRLIPVALGTLDVSVSVPEWRSVHNQIQALKVRLLFDRTIDEEIASEYVAYGTQLLDEIMSPVEVKPVSTADRRVYLRERYSAAQTEKYMRNFCELADISKLFQCGFFVKPEAYPGKAPEDLKCRVICNPPPAAVVTFGPVVEQLAEHVKERFGRAGFVWCSKMSPAEVGRLCVNLHGRGFAYKMDGSNFDGSYTPADWVLIKYLFEKFFEIPADLKEAFMRHAGHHGISKPDAEVKLLDLCVMCSGFPTTYFLNCLVNCLKTGFVMHKLGISRKGYTLGVSGDDGVCGVDQPLDEKYAAYIMESLGMTWEPLLCENVEDMHFCSQFPLPVDGVWVMTLLPFRAASKGLVNFSGLARRRFADLVYGYCRSTAPNLAHCPIFGRWYSYLASVGMSRKMRAIVPKGENPHRFTSTEVWYVAHDTRASFAAKYGIDPDLQVAIEDWLIDKVGYEQLPFFIDDANFLEGFAIDVGPAERSYWYISEGAGAGPNLMYELARAAAEEEVQKLYDIGPFSEGTGRRLTLFESLAKARKFGAYEDSVYGTGVMMQVRHMSWTLVAQLFSEEWAIRCHEEYNIGCVLNACQCLASRKNAKRMKRAPQQQMPRRKKREPLKQFARALARKGIVAGSSAIGTYLAGPAGGAIGADAGRYLSKITGMGGYSVSANTLYNSSAVPSFGDTPMVVKHRAYLGDVTGSTLFSATTYTINPGNVSTFPWLSTIAIRFQEYRLLGMVFEFIPTCATAVSSTNTALGTVIMATQYNPNEPVFTSKLDMENSAYACSSTPFAPLVHPIECDPSKVLSNARFIRTATTNVKEAQLYDWGNFTIATVGMQASNVIGELWISFHIELMLPRLNPAAYPNPLSARISNGPFDANNTLGVIQRGVGGNMPIQVTATGSGFDTIVLPSFVGVGRFMLVAFWSASTFATDFTYTYTNCAIGTSGYGFTLDTARTVGKFAPTTANLVRISIFDVTAPNASIRFSGGSFTSPGAVDIYLWQIPPPTGMPLGVPSLLGANSTALYKALPPEVQADSHVLSLLHEFEELELKWEHD
jgi:hypothetical protein